MRIIPPDGFVEATISLPLSKSLSNRALIIAALSGLDTDRQPAAHCDDSEVMRAALKSDCREINVGAAGTAMRFLTAYFACADSRERVLDGSERMRQRPIGPLVDALRQLGADISYLGREGYPPLLIRGRGLEGGDVRLEANISSQFVTALMLIAPYMHNGLSLHLEGERISTPYIDMTVAMMQRAGARVEPTDYGYDIAAGAYLREPLTIEPDWSAASYWYEIQALAAGEITLPGLQCESLQGDCRTARYFERLGVTTTCDDNGVTLGCDPEVVPRFEQDMSGNPDIAQTLAVTCVMLGIPFRLTGLSTLRIKETDRIAALKTEMMKVGVILDDTEEASLSWDGTRYPIGDLPVFDTYDDHRMAMALAPVALYIPGIVIRDADVVAKSYPDFWHDLEQAGFTFVSPTAE